MQIEIDASDFLRFADDLEQAVDELAGKVRPVVSKGALNVKKAMQADMAASEHFGQAASSITYDLNGSVYAPEAEIGPRKGGAGDLANLAYFGGTNGGGGTVRDPQAALDDEAPKLEAALSALIGDVL